MGQGLWVGQALSVPTLAILLALPSTLTVLHGTCRHGNPSIPNNSVLLAPSSLSSVLPSPPGPSPFPPLGFPLCCSLCLMSLINLLHLSNSYPPGKTKRGVASLVKSVWITCVSPRVRSPWVSQSSWPLLSMTWLSRSVYLSVSLLRPRTCEKRDRSDSSVGPQCPA